MTYHACLAMSGMLNFMRFWDGLYVDRKAQMIETVKMEKNSLRGKVRGVGIPMNIDLCMVMDQPTQVPMMTPEKELDNTRIKAS